MPVLNFAKVSNEKVSNAKSYIIIKLYIRMHTQSCKKSSLKIRKSNKENKPNALRKNINGSICTSKTIDLDV